MVTCILVDFVAAFTSIASQYEKFLRGPARYMYIKIDAERLNRKW